MFGQFFGRPVVSKMVLGCFCVGVGNAFAQDWGSIGVQADLLGAAHYPNTGLDSIGNETQVTFGTHSGFVPGYAGAAVSLDKRYSGVDYNGTSGTVSVSGAVTAEVGVLRAFGSVSSSSTASVDAFPHADSSLNFGAPPVAQFWDITKVYNPGYPIGYMLPVTLGIELDWTPTFESSDPEATHYVSGASGTFGVQWYGNVGVEVDEDERARSGTTRSSYNVMISNGTEVNLYGSLTILAGSRVFGAGGGTTTAGATSDAAHTAHYYLDSSVAGTTFLDTNGYDYSHPADVASVPESGFAIPTMLALATVALSRSRRCAR